MYFKSLRSNENSSFRTEIQSMNRDLQGKDQLIKSEKERFELHIEELNLQLTKQIDEINSKNETFEQTQNRLVEL